MAKQDKRFPYELLVRGREDGGIAAHVQWRRIVSVDGEVLKDEIEPAVAITPDTDLGSAFQGLIGIALATSVADSAAKGETIQAQAEQIERQRLNENELRESLVEMQAAMEAAQAEYQAEIAERDQRIAALTRPARTAEAASQSLKP